MEPIFLIISVRFSYALRVTALTIAAPNREDCGRAHPNGTQAFTLPYNVCQQSNELFLGGKHARLGSLKFIKVPMRSIKSGFVFG